MERRPALTLLTRNEILQEAQELLEGEDRERFIDFSDRLSRTLDGESIIPFPAPFILADPLTEAEALAEQYLSEGSGSLWSALRMVARCLDYETDTRQHAGGLSFRLGLYNKGGLMGLTKQSRRHYSVARLFNAAIAHVLSTHTWTTLSVNLDNMTVPHYDRGNAPGGSLLLGLTHHSAGGLWICDGSGSQLLEAEGVLSRGTPYSTHASVVLFEGRDCLHSTLPWSGNRCVIIAYTIGQYKSMEKEHQIYLETAGFRLPDLLAPDGRLEAPAGQPSATYAVQQRLRFGPAE